MSGGELDEEGVVNAGTSFGGVVGKGRVRRRSAREYWCVIKYVWASQNASFGSSGEIDNLEAILDTMLMNILVQLMILSPQKEAVS